MGRHFSGTHGDGSSEYDQTGIRKQWLTLRVSEAELTLMQVQEVSRSFTAVLITFEAKSERSRSVSATLGLTSAGNFQRPPSAEHARAAFN